MQVNELVARHLYDSQFYPRVPDVLFDQLASYQKMTWLKEAQDLKNILNMNGYQIVRF